MILLAPEPVALYAAEGADSHGWALPGSAELWAGHGTLQAAPGVSDGLAGAGGGHGPYDPRSGASATLYLPPDAPVADGLVATVAGRRFYLSQTRLVTDPRGTGDLDCYVATATESGQWVP